MSRSILPVALMLFFQMPVSAQITDVIDNFTVRQLGEGVIVEWRIRKGEQCFNMEVQRGDDSVEYVMLEAFHGICGSDADDTWYEYFDPGPFNTNQSYFYRIEASSGTVLSTTREVEFLETDAGSLSVFPNPMQNRAEVFYTNTGGELISLQIFDLQGRRVYASNPSSESQFEILKGNLTQGIYLVQIVAEGEIRASKKLYVN